MRKRRKNKVEIRNVFAYVRVSTVEQAERDNSIPAQFATLRRYAKDRGYNIVREYEEAGQSGTDENRPAFKRMMQDVFGRPDDVDAILVIHTSRFMRNSTLAGVWKEKLRELGVRLLSSSQEITDDPMGDFIEKIFQSVDQYESDINGLRTRAAMRENARRGFFNGSRAPFGFAATRIETGADKGKRQLVPNPIEVPVLHEVFRSYVGGLGAKLVARDLNKRGYHYRGSVPWNKAHVMKVIDEEAAIGTYYWGAAEAPVQEGAADSAPAAKRDDERIAIPVEPVIEREVFAMAQKVRSDRDPKRNPGRTPSSPLLLARLLKCGKCGASFQLETSGKKNAEGTPYDYRYYQCRSQARVGDEKCTGHRVRTVHLEKQVLDHVVERLFTEDHCHELLRDMVEGSGILKQKTLDHRLRVQNELDGVEAAIRKWQEAFEAGKLPEELGNERLEELGRTRAELKATLSKVVILRAPPPNIYSPANIRRFQESLRSALFGTDVTITKNYLRFLIEEIVVTDHHVRIVARSEAVAQMLAAEGTNPALALTREGQVRTCDSDWLRKPSPLRAFSV